MSQVHVFAFEETCDFVGPEDSVFADYIASCRHVGQNAGRYQFDSMKQIAHDWRHLSWRICKFFLNHRPDVRSQAWSQFEPFLVLQIPQVVREVGNPDQTYKSYFEKLISRIDPNKDIWT